MPAFDHAFRIDIGRALARSLHDLDPRQDRMPISKVMMVDDEPDIRTIGQLSLSAIGKWQTVLVDSGREALAVAAREQPDVVLLDVMMPGMDGLATLAGLKEQAATSSIPVIFMTAKVQKHEVERYLQLGAVGVIRKPFDPVTLPAEIRKLLGEAS
jgi:CheY-like chemotaxis protein